MPHAAATPTSPAGGVPPGASPRLNEEAEAYFRAIEEHFIDRRGRPLLLSPADVARVVEWHASGVPLAAVIEGIDIHFDRLARRRVPARRAVTLAYVEDDVAEAWAGARRRRQGRAAAGAETASGERSPLEDHARMIDGLTAAAARLWTGDAVSRAVAPAVEEAAGRLDKKAALFDPSREEHDAQKAEDVLRRMERSLQARLREAAGDEAVAGIAREVEAELGDRRSRMDDATWTRIVNQLVDKRLRDRFGLPRLSLFYT